jgi:hypothetical protein
METEATTNYWGMADCNGLSSFMEVPHESWDEWGLGPSTGRHSQDEFKTQIGMACMSARANPQRWSVVYKAEVRDSDAEILNEMMEFSPFEALKALKKCALKIELATGMGINIKKVWDKIPDRSLDPSS